VYNHSYWPGVWIGYTTGISGFNTYMSYMDELQLCWQPSTAEAPLVYIRVKKENMKPYVLRVFEYNNAANKLSPELLNFNPEYGSSTLVETDSMIKFNFKPMAVYPSKYQYTYLDGFGNPVLNTSFGRLIIYRGAILEDGSTIKMDNLIFWAVTNLDEDHLPDPF